MNDVAARLLLAIGAGVLVGILDLWLYDVSWRVAGSGVFSRR